MYLDNELMDIDHLCCLAHARAKFKYAFDQGSPQARIFLEQIAKLYGMEDTYRREKFTADEIYRRRNSKETVPSAVNLVCGKFFPAISIFHAV